MAHDKHHKKKKTSGWDIFLYVIGAIVAMVVLFMIFERLTGGSSNATGRRHMGKTGMHIVAAIMALIILYLLFKNIYDGYENTLAGEPWLVETTKNAQHMSVVPGSKIPRSSGGRFGLEFSYSMWLYINEWNSSGSRLSGSTTESE